MDKFTEIERGANIGAMGLNNLPEPSSAQAVAGNYKMGRVNFHGLSIAIENPRGTFRTGVNKSTGKAWSNRMAAHYGYLVGTRGNDGDGIDVFVGHAPESERVFVINQIDSSTGAFDEHKILLGFYGLNDAKTAYNSSYDRGWAGIGSIVEASLTQIKWWIKHGNKKAPILTSALPQEGYSNMQQTQWKNGEDGGTPIGASLDEVLYGIRRNDPDNLIFDSVSMDQVMSDADESITLDALVIPFAQVERKMGQLKEIMGRAGTDLKVTSLQISPPFKQRGVANVAAIYELSDGQTVTAYFHNPDTNPSKLTATDEMISWKWLLNKKDITIIAAPERGEDLNPREVARRLMKLAEKNSAAFKRVNVKRSERMASIESLKGEVSAKESELTTLQEELATKRAAKEKRTSEKAAEPAANEADSPMPAQSEANTYGKNVVSVYSTASGKEAMKISKNEGSRGVTYSYIGSYGAGSGHSFEHMLEEVNYQKRFRRGMHVSYGVEFAEVGKSVSEPANDASLPIANAAETSEPAPSEDDADTASPVTFDLSEAVGDFEKAKVIRDLADDQSKRFSGALQAFKDQHPSLQFGITPDDVKAMPEYQLLSKNSDFAFNELRRVNEWIVKNFKNENSEDVRKGREVRLANAPLFESLKKAGVLYIQRGKSLYLGKLNKATGDTTIQQYANNKQADDAVAKLLGQGFAAHVSARHPFVVVIDGASEPKSVDLPAYQEVAGAVDAPIQISGNELGDFPDTNEGKKAMRAVAGQAYEELIKNDPWVDCPAIAAKVGLRKSGFDKIRSFSADTRKLKIIPHLRELISKSKPIGGMKPNYDIANSPNIVGYQTMRVLVNIADVELAVRFVLGKDDKGVYHYDHTIHQAEAVFDSVKENEPAIASSLNSLAGGNLGCTHDRSAVSEPSSLLSANPSAEHQADSSVANIEHESKMSLDSVETSGGEIINLFIEGESPEPAGGGSVDDDTAAKQPENQPEVKNTDKDGRAALMSITPFISRSQRSILAENMRGEEGQYFIDKVVEMADIIEKMPKTYDQDGMGDKAIVSLHYFKGGSDWYITEKDMDGGVKQAFGYAVLNGDTQNAELGYISIEELTRGNVELDLHWSITTLGAVKGGASEENGVSEDTSKNVASGVVADPIENEAWKMSVSEVKALRETDFNAICDKLTDANYHSEALILMAARFGTDEQYYEAKKIKTRCDINECTTDLDARLRDKLVESVKKTKMELDVANLPSEVKKRIDKAISDGATFLGKLIKNPAYEASVQAGLKFEGDLYVSDLRGNGIEIGLSGYVEHEYAKTRLEDLTEQSKYTPFDPSSIKMPTVNQLGIGAGSNKLRFFEDENNAAVDGWTNGYVLDISNTPKFVIDAKSDIEKEEGEARWLKSSDRDRVVNNAKTGSIELTPIANFKEEIKVAGGKVFKHLAIILGNVEKNISKQVDKYGYAYFVKMYKGAEFFSDAAENKSVVVKHHGVVVGVLMPMRANDKDKDAIRYSQNAAKNTTAEKVAEVATAIDLKPSPLDAFENGGGEAWQVTRAKWVEIMRGHMASLGQSSQDSEFEGYHKSQVKSALDAGKSVPAEVLADYPDLKAETQEEKDARYEKTAQALKNVVSVAAGGVIADPLEQDAAKDPDINKPTSVDDPKDEPKVNPTNPDRKIDDPLESDAAIAPQPSVAEEVKAVVDDPLEVVEAAKIPQLPIAEKPTLGAPPTLDYRLKESGGSTYLVPIIGKGFSQKDRDDLKNWLRNAGYFVSVIGDHKISVSETSISPKLTEIDDGQEVQKMNNWAKTPEAQKMRGELAGKTSAVSVPSAADDEALLQSVIDGKADIWDASLAGKLEAILGRIAGNEALQAKWAKAINAYSTAALAVAQKTING